jgi:hypothetical protein
LLAREAADWQTLTGYWRGLPEEAWLLPGAGGSDWNVKDLMNHIAAWLEAAARIIPELAAGRPATLGHGTDRFNALEYAASRERSLAATRRRLHRARRDFLASIQPVPDALLLDPKGRINWWVKYNSYSHYSQHFRQLAAFRAQLEGRRPR